MTAIGIDLGGTKVQGAVVEHGTAVKDARVATPTAGPDSVVAAIVELVAELGGTKGIDAIGIGAPGVIDPGTGTVVRAPNLVGFDQPVPLGDRLAEALHVDRVVVENDVNVGVIAEHRHGAGQGVDELLGVFAGTGVGGGLILGGHLRRGPNGIAGEIGHMVVEEGGRRCGCGHDGHVEAYAGRGSMEREARRRHAEGEATLLVELAGDDRMRSGIFAKALDKGDAVATELLDEAVKALGAGIAAAAALVDLELVILGGGVADKLGPAFVGRVEQATRSRLFVPTSTLRVVPAALGDLGGAIGAASLATHPHQ